MGEREKGGEKEREREEAGTQKAAWLAHRSHCRRGPTGVGCEGACGWRRGMPTTRSNLEGFSRTEAMGMRARDDPCLDRPCSLVRLSTHYTTTLRCKQARCPSCCLRALPRLASCSPFPVRRCPGPATFFSPLPPRRLPKPRRPLPPSHHLNLSPSRRHQSTKGWRSLSIGVGHGGGLPLLIRSQALTHAQACRQRLVRDFVFASSHAKAPTDTVAVVGQARPSSRARAWPSLCLHTHSTTKLLLLLLLLYYTV